VFVDIDRDTLTLDPEKVARSITPKTKAILAVDIYGYPCKADLMRKIADEHGLLLIQDCAQSFGAYFQGITLAGMQMPPYSL
jgi:perosamine synthetase